jgi:hypothetical protein
LSKQAKYTTGSYLPTGIVKEKYTAEAEGRGELMRDQNNISQHSFNYKNHTTSMYTY